MNQLGDNLMLSQLNIPGTHESCAHATYVHDWADCQDWSLQDQLNHGIRYIDIRCRHINDGFDLYHGDVQIVSSLYSNAGLKFAADVRDVCVAFLKANPKECIIMQIKRESSDSNNTQTFEQTLDGYLKGFESFFYLDDHVPTLGEVRGKIVVVRRFGLDQNSTPRGIAALPWADNATFSVNYTAANRAAVRLEVQDQYQYSFNLFNPGAPIADKWNNISALLDRAKSDTSNAWYINETSATDLPELTPRSFATGLDGLPPTEGINPKLNNYLAGAPFPHRLGTLLADFPDDNMIGRIIGLNR